MTLCLLLTGCQGNINKTEQKEEKQETADAAQTEIECEYTWATSHCAVSYTHLDVYKRQLYLDDDRCHRIIFL